MDMGSKIKELKEDCQTIDDTLASTAKRINELKSLIEEKKKKETKLLELIALERQLLETL